MGVFFPPFNIGNPSNHEIIAFDGTSWSNVVNSLTPLGSQLSVNSDNVNNSEVLVSSDISVPLRASTRYGFFLYIEATSNATADLSTLVLAPTGATGTISIFGQNQSNTGLAVEFVSQHSSNARVHCFAGHINMSTTAGNIVLQFTQGTATVVNTFLEGGTYLVCWELSQD